MQQSITKRQAEFLAKSAKGMTYKQIADNSYVTINTVRSTFRNARKRLGASTNTQAVVLAIAREELCLDHDGICEVPQVVEPGGIKRDKYFQWQLEMLKSYKY